MYKDYYVYILTNASHTVLYTGVTNDIYRRVKEHKSGIKEGFTKKYNTNILVYYERFFDINQAIRREKTIKNLLRSKKEALINSFNPEWNELFIE